jgi:transglutaminase-like putative cysteine protease
MRRTALLGALGAIAVVSSWARLEHEPVTRELLAWALAVGVLPALLPTTRLRFAAVPIAALVGIGYAVGTIWPGEVRKRVADGFYLFYDVALPFRPDAQPRMHALVVLAILAFTLAIALAVAERRALLATGLLVAGAAWPATLLTSSNTFDRGAVILVAALAMVAGLSASFRARQAAIAGAVAVVAAVGLAGIPAVAKGAFLAWEKWEPSRAGTPAAVSYVWQSNYESLTFPAKRTTVLSIEAPPVSRYWRATTLDTFNGDGWLESTLPVQPDPVVDPLLPREALRQDRQVRAEVTVKALEDPRLVAASVPVRYDVGDLDPVLYAESGTAYHPGYVPQGTKYTSWSYAARPSPAELARSLPRYPRSLDRYLIVQTRYETPPTPAFGSPGRRRDMNILFQENPRLREYRRLYTRALAIARDTPSPYAAAVALETYFRDGQNFTYDQHPNARGDIPPLVEFVTRTHRGFCQHFAGAMALMLRYLGIPARVGAGFTSGDYDQENGTWTVTDHDAHTWVEVWFDGYGWLPFDPTPGRGDLDGSYSAASLSFNPAALAAAFAAIGVDAADFKLDTERFDRGDAVGRGAQGRDVPGDIGATGQNDRQDSLLRLLLLVAAGLAAAIALLKLGLRRSRYLTSDPRRIAAACRRELADFLADQRVDVPESASLGELAELLRKETGLDVSRFVDAVDLARFGPPDVAPDAARRAQRELRRLERALRQQLSRWDRTRGLLSVRSLGLT